MEVIQMHAVIENTRTNRALGLTDRKASSTLIRQAYMSKAKVCHPDVNDSPEVSVRAVLQITPPELIRTHTDLQWIMIGKAPNPNVFFRQPRNFGKFQMPMSV